MRAYVCHLPWCIFLSKTQTTYFLDWKPIKAIKLPGARRRQEKRHPTNKKQHCIAEHILHVHMHVVDGKKLRFFDLPQPCQQDSEWNRYQPRYISIAIHHPQPWPALSCRLKLCLHETIYSEVFCVSIAVWIPIQRCIRRNKIWFCEKSVRVSVR